MVNPTFQWRVNRIQGRIFKLYTNTTLQKVFVNLYYYTNQQSNNRKQFIAILSKAISLK